MRTHYITENDWELILPYYPYIILGGRRPEVIEATIHKITHIFPNSNWVSVPQPRKSETRTASSFCAFHFHGHRCPDLSCNLWSRQNGWMDTDLRAIGQLESVVADQDRQNSLKQPGKGREGLVAPCQTHGWYMREVHLEFCQRKAPSQTYPRTVGECQYVPVPLDFLRSPKVIHLKPSLRLKLPRVGTPKFLRAVQVRDG
jgi:hypothetical protein